MRRLLTTLGLSLYLLCAGATTHVNDSGTWREIQGIYVNDAGTWREIQEVYVNDAGTWRSVFVNAVVSLSNWAVTCTEISPSDAIASYSLESTGDILEGAGGSCPSTDIGDWITPKSVASNAYEVRCTVSSGTLSSGTCDGVTWQGLGTGRGWSRVRTNNSPGTDTAVISLSIRRASDGVVHATATITLRAIVEL